MDSKYATWTVGAIFLSTLWVLFQLMIRPKLEAKKPFPDLPMPPNSHWLVGHLALFRKAMSKVRSGDIFQHCNEHGQVGVWLFGIPMIILFHVEDARTVLHSEYFVKVSPLGRAHVSKTIGTKPITTMHGREWKLYRDAIHRSMTPAALAAAHIGMIEVAKLMVQSLRARLHQDSSKHVTWKVEELMKMVTMDVFGRTTLSVDLGCCEQLATPPIAGAFDFLMGDVIRRVAHPLNPMNWLYSVPTTLNRRNQRERKILQSFLQTQMENSLQDKLEGKQTPIDTLAFLMDVSDEDEVLSDEGIRSVLMALLLAGQDTTSVTLTFVLYLLAKHPEVESNCLAEISRVFCSKEQNGIMVHPNELVYCNAVILETLRLYPPGPTANRSLQKPVELSGGFVAPKGTSVYVNIEILQRQERHFSNASDFQPDRWVSRKDGKEEGDWVNQNREGTNPQAFLAFSAGGRNCAGRTFAIHEAVLVLAVLLPEFKFELLSDDYVVNSVRRGSQHPDDGLPMKIRHRT